MPGIAALCLGYVFSQFFRAFLAVLTPVLKNDLGMTATDLAYASGAWFVAFALFQFPVGVLLDTKGPRLTSGIIFTVFCGGGAFLFSAAESPTTIIIAMALIGVGCSPALMAPMYIFVRNYDAAKFATLVSIYIGVGTLGNIASSEPLAAAVEAFGWRQSAIVLAVTSFLCGLSMLLLVRDPEKVGASPDGKGGYRELFGIRELWPIFPIVVVGYVAAAGLRGSWIGPFHADIYDYDTLQIGRAVLFMSIALVLGTLFYGPLDRIFNSRKRVVFAGNLIVLGLCLAMVYHIPQDPFWGIVAISAIGFFGASYTVQMAHGKSFVPAHLTGRGVTLLNFCSIGGAGLLQWISGPVVELAADPDNKVAQYETLFMFYAVITFVALVVYFFSKDAKPEAKE